MLFEINFSNLDIDTQINYINCSIRKKTGTIMSITIAEKSRENTFGGVIYILFIY